MAGTELEALYQEFVAEDVNILRALYRQWCVASKPGDVVTYVNAKLDEINLKSAEISSMEADSASRSKDSFCFDEPAG